jgi:hypothetical protein
MKELKLDIFNVKPNQYINKTSGAHRIFFQWGGEDKNIIHFTINTIMQILNIF